MSSRGPEFAPESKEVKPEIVEQSPLVCMLESLRAQTDAGEPLTLPEGKEISQIRRGGLIASQLACEMCGVHFVFEHTDDGVIVQGVNPPGSDIFARCAQTER